MPPCLSLCGDEHDDPAAGQSTGRTRTLAIVAGSAVAALVVVAAIIGFSHASESDATAVIQTTEQPTAGLGTEVRADGIRIVLPPG